MGDDNTTQTPAATPAADNATTPAMPAAEGGMPATGDTPSMPSAPAPEAPAMPATGGDMPMPTPSEPAMPAAEGGMPATGDTNTPNA